MVSRYQSSQSYINNIFVIKVIYIFVITIIVISIIWQNISSSTFQPGFRNKERYFPEKLSTIFETMSRLRPKWDVDWVDHVVSNVVHSSSRRRSFWVCGMPPFEQSFLTVASDCGPLLVIYRLNCYLFQRVILNAYIWLLWTAECKNK